LSNAKYAFISAYLKGAEAKVLTSEHVERMSRISNVQDVVSSVREVLDIISDTEAGGYLEEALVRTFDDADRYLWLYFGHCLGHLEWLKLVPDDMRQVLRAYLVKYDVINIKATLQGMTVGKKASLIPVGVIHHQGQLDELARAETVADVTQLLRLCNLGDYADLLQGYSLEDARSRFLAEARLEGKYYENLLRVSRKITDGSLLAKAFGVMIDMTNLALVTRAVVEGVTAEASEVIIKGGYMISPEVAKDLLGEKLTDLASAPGVSHYREVAEEIASGYQRAKSITIVEEVIDRYRFRWLKDLLSPRVLTPLVLAWYLIVKEAEVRNLRLIMKATFDAIPVAEIKEYLVSA
jgi:vacuolar-type H+-ATPase subunit C/Vma6